jgi:hypothetical protein
MRIDPYKPKDRIDELAQDALKALTRIKKKGLTKELRVDITKATKDLQHILMDNHHQA